jgi:signal transduction histidine kinase
MKQHSHPGSNTPTHTDLNEVIRSAATLTRNQWKYVCDVDLDLHKGECPVECFPAELGQVFINLLNNAADAIAAKIEKAGAGFGTITIRTRREDQQVNIEFEDDGCGMSDVVRQKAFDPFFTTKDVGKGTGQGLHISYKVIVDMHHGSIHVESTPDVGTLFRISLPLEQTRVDVERPSDPTEVDPSQDLVASSTA